MPDFDTIRYEIAGPKIARITLDRPGSRNAQNTHLLYELNDAFDRAAQDDEVSVIVLAASDPHFSSGHDLHERESDALRAAHRTVGTWCGFGCAGAESWMAREKEIYLGFCERWRNIPKPVLAEVQGAVVGGGLMLVWPCDVVVASEDAEFTDNSLLMGVNGAEFFHHPWEVGVRKAKEMLFTAGTLTASEAHRLGMVNHVVARAELTDFTMRLAVDIARKPLFALKLAKESVNAAQDSQGRVSAMQTAFALHQLTHIHNLQVHGEPIDPGYYESRFGMAVKRDA